MDNKPVQNNSVRVRIAPSPTGYTHIGLARTALFNYAFAKKSGGSFLLRIEDTDRERSKKEYEDEIKENLSWLGIEWDEEPLRQSERGEVYKTYLQKMIDAGHAYISQEEATEDDPKKRAEVIRFKNPNKIITFTDIIRGEVSIDTTDLEDFVIAKDLDTPLYHLAVVIDDFESGITHIIRGDDGISNTPRQILIQEAIGAPRPVYAHIPLIVAPDRSKLSKRHGAHAVRDFRERGYLKEALVNFIALLGWHPEKSDKELYTLSEFIDEFSLERVVKSAAVFDNEKLNWFNREYMRNDPHIGELLKEHIPPAVTFSPLLGTVILERISTLQETNTLFEKDGELSFLINEPVYEKELLIEKKKNPTPEEVEKHLQCIIKKLSEISDTLFSPENIKEQIWDYATEAGRGVVLWPMRTALTGKERSPDPFTVAALLGKEKTLIYLKKACDTIRG
jgi:glutamyl-tRNA synthetase